VLYVLYVLYMLYVLCVLYVLYVYSVDGKVLMSAVFCRLYFDVFFCSLLGLWYGASLIATQMEDRTECHYRYNVDDGGGGSLQEPDADCLSGGDVMTCFFAILFGGLQLVQASPALTAINSARVELGKVQAISNRQSDIDPSSEAGVKISSPLCEIQFSNVSFHYPERPDHSVYSGLNLCIEAGTTVALVGPSGSGKSSLVGLVERFYDVTGGSVLLDGHDIKDLNVNWLRSLIGYVGQEPVLFSGTIAENITYGRADASREEAETAAKQANAHDFISSFPQGYETMVGERGIQLSGGQKQRIAIARAIVRNPQILILDEATSALDTTSERVVQAALDALLQLSRHTTIVIAHRLSTIRNADKIVVLMDGVVIETGTHEQLLAIAEGHYQELIHSSTDPLTHSSTL
jgi:ATP-binding cassette subfamily B (MDR/TAP) protein 1